MLLTIIICGFMIDRTNCGHRHRTNYNSLLPRNRCQFHQSNLKTIVWYFVNRNFRFIPPDLQCDCKSIFFFFIWNNRKPTIRTQPEIRYCDASKSTNYENYLMEFRFYFLSFPLLIIRHQRAWHHALNACGYRIRKKLIWKSRYGCIVVVMVCVSGCRYFHEMLIVAMVVIDTHSCQNASCYRLHWKSIHWQFYSKMR